MTTDNHHLPEPERVYWPRFRLLFFIALAPFLTPLVLAFWPAGKEWVNVHPWWTVAIGAASLTVWLGLFGDLLADGLDFWLRTFDFVINRSFGPDVKGYPFRTRVRMLLARGGLLHGYSLPIVLWTLLAGLIVVFGPTRTPLNDTPWLDDAPALVRGTTLGEVALGLAITVGIPVAAMGVILVLWLLLAIVLSRFTERKHCLHLITTLLLLGSSALVTSYLWLTTADPAEKTQAENIIYPHIFLWFIALAAVFTYFARFMAWWLLRDFQQAPTGRNWAQPEVLAQTELFVELASIDEQQMTFYLLLRGHGSRFLRAFRRNLRSAVNTPIRQPHLLLYPIAAMVLLVPSDFIRFAAVDTGLFAWSVLAVAGNHERLNNVLSWLQRLFFDGALWGASLLVIVLGACRLLDVSYVATITNSTSNLTLFWFLLSIYVTLWYYKYWTGHVMGEQLLQILGPGQPSDRPLDYPLDPKYQGDSWVRPTDRYLQVHGRRFVAVGVFDNENEHGQAWEFYDQIGLFETIAQRQRTTPEEVEQVFGLSDLRQRVQLFHVLCDGLAAAVLVGFFWLQSLPEAKAELDAADTGAPPFALEDHLFRARPAKPGDREPKAVVLVSASGGGTRAALYAASVLRGLDRISALGDVKLCSGVSGGSTAIAHLAIHRQGLLADGGPAWDRYARVMSASFIDDVLCGALEQRESRGYLMGTLLDESFHRYMYAHEKRPLKEGLTLNDAKDFGIIFNTSLAGTKKPDEAAPDPTQAGSRLVVTNLRNAAAAFPSEEGGFPDLETEYLHYVVVTDPTARLTTGAALSANFPPVFPNAAVDVKTSKGVDRHWITDGGAEENRGTISLLYALLHALRQEARKKTDRREPLPIHIVIIEASALSLDFSQDRGLSPALGAAEKVAGQLALELLKQVHHEYYKELNGKDLDVHFLPMPLVMRSRGGVGTHWKLPAFVKIANPQDKEDSLVLSNRQAREIIMDLYVPEGSRRSDAAQGNEKELLDKAWSWIEGKGEKVPDRYRQHRENWNRLETVLTGMGYKAK
jgi:hypothetical protein